MSQENVEIVRRRYEHLAATGEHFTETTALDFVWDMSTFRGWPEQQTYEGAEEARGFLRNWIEIKQPLLRGVFVHPRRV